MRRLLDALAAKRLAPRSRTGLLGILSGVLRYGVRQGVVEHNVVRDLDRDDRPGAARMTEPRYLSRDELERLLAGMGDTFRPVAAACAYAGLRLSEALGLRWRDVDLKAGTLDRDRAARPDGERVPLKTAASRRDRADPAAARRGATRAPLPRRGRRRSPACGPTRSFHHRPREAARPPERAPRRLRGR